MSYRWRRRADGGKFGEARERTGTYQTVARSVGRACRNAGVNYFSTVDAGQVTLHVHVGSAVRTEEAQRLFQQVEDTIHLRFGPLRCLLCAMPELSRRTIR